MRSTVVYVTLVSLAIATEGREYNLAFWSNIFTPRGIKGCTTDNCEIFIPEKRGESEGVEQVQQTANYYRLPNGPGQSCPCESQYGVLDLGHGNYPRYLPTANCVLKPCHNKFNQCKLIHYKVHVLKHRDLNDSNDTSEEQYIEQPSLPESLRPQWQLKPIRTAVACISASEGRIN